MESKINDIKNECAELRKRLNPDILAKSLDSSYLSVGNLRAFLQILSIILTVFVAGAIYFGSVGLTSILSIRDDAKEVEDIRQSTQAIYDQAAAIAKQIEQTVKDVDAAIPVLDAKTDAEIEKIAQKTDERFKQVDKEVQDVASQLKSISDIFNSISISSQDLLSARERQLLFLLAKEISPDSPTFNFNAAHSALAFGRYDDALRLLEVVLKSDNVPDEIRNRAVQLREEAQRLRDNPPKLEYRAVTGPSIGPYGIFEFPLNILDALVRNGYLTIEQAQKIIEASKRQ